MTVRRIPVYPSSYRKLFGRACVLTWTIIAPPGSSVYYSLANPVPLEQRRRWACGVGRSRRCGLARVLSGWGTRVVPAPPPVGIAFVIAVPIAVFSDPLVETACGGGGGWSAVAAPPRGVRGGGARSGGG